jgi:CRP-like cAMP-binding protein
MKNLSLNKVTTYHIETLSLFSKPKLYKTESHIIYEGQIPHAGYLLIEGEIHFIKKKNIIQKIKAGTLFGVTELMSNSPLKFTVKILPNSKVCILDKSTVKEIIKDIDKENLPPALQKMVG